MGSSKDRQKRLARKERQRNRARYEKRRSSRSSTARAIISKAEKVADHVVYLRDGRHAAHRYYAYWHIYVQDKRVGRVWLSRNPTSEELPGVYITVEINKPEQGKGVGQVVFRRAAELSNESSIIGVSRKSNIGSIKAMERAGYSLTGTTKSGESVYTWHRSLISRSFPKELAHLSEGVDLSDHKITEQQAMVTLTLREDHGVSKDPGAASTASDLVKADSAAISQYRVLHHTGGRTTLFSMVHSWALVGASYHAWRTGRIPSQVVHIDDHTDLSSCLMDDSVNPPSGRGGAPYILAEPATIIENLFRGSFNKGSYLTAFLGLANVRCVHHICWPSKASGAFVSTGQGSQPVLCVTYADTGATAFRSGADLQPWDDSDEPVWLDIDLDAFCNRYNGDSDRRGLRANASEKRRLDQRMDEAIAMIRGCKALRSAELVTIAVSPGFCPSEYWEEASCKMLDAVGISWKPF